MFLVLLFLCCFIIRSTYTKFLSKYLPECRINSQNSRHQKISADFRHRSCNSPSLRLFFHDCFVRGCDASIFLANANAEKDHHDDLSLAGDGFDTVIKAKAAVDSNPSCRNKVSCADILTLATRDVVALSLIPFDQGKKFWKSIQSWRSKK